ncbi:MAG: PAS domain S-box protein, partial [Pedobacter sp.]
NQVIKMYGAATDIHDSKDAADALREREEKFRSIFEGIDEGYTLQELILDDEGNVTDVIYREVNQAFAKQLGIANGAGKRLKELFPNVEQYWLDSLTSVYKTGEPLRVEGYQADLGRWMTAHYVRIEASGGPLISAVFQDITERKQHEQLHEFLLNFSDALRVEENPEAMASRALGILLKELHLDHCCIALIRQADNYIEVIHQVTAKETPELPKDGIYLSNILEAPDLVFNRTLVINDILEWESLSETSRKYLSSLGLQSILCVTLRKGDNAPHWLIAVASGTPRRWTGSDISMIEQVSERTWSALEAAKAGEALREREIRMRTLADAIPHIIWGNNANGAANYFNKRWYE